MRVWIFLCFLILAVAHGDVDIELPEPFAVRTGDVQGVASVETVAADDDYVPRETDINDDVAIAEENILNDSPGTDEETLASASAVGMEQEEPLRAGAPSATPVGGDAPPAIPIEKKETLEMPTDSKGLSGVSAETKANLPETPAEADSSIEKMADTSETTMLVDNTEAETPAENSETEAYNKRYWNRKSKVPASRIPDKPNKIQYHHRLFKQEIGHKIYKEVVQIGFENPTGYIVGQKIRITGRSNRRAGSPEAAEYLNREKGHEVLYVSDPEDDISIGGNGGFIWIKALRGLPSDSFESGNDNEHTADGATSTICPDCPENTLEEADLVQPETKPEPGQESEEGGEEDTVLTEEVLPVQEPERNTVDNSWSPGEIN